MRFEATLPDGRGQALVELAQELGLSRSQLMDEALGLLLKVVMETRRGGRVVVVDAEEGRPWRELVTPTLAHLEWTHHKGEAKLSQRGLERLAKTLQDPPEPSEELRRLMGSEGA